MNSGIRPRSRPGPADGRGRDLRRALAAVLAAVGLALLVVPTPAGAAGATRIVDDGWWWRLQSGVLTELPPPGVEDDQLLVQSTPEGAQAIAAVSAELADGQTNPILTLDAADASGADSAVVLACQAGAAWTGTHAGRWDSKPSADCSTSVTGIASEDGTQWSFAVGSLQFNDKLNLVIVPGVLADADVAPTFSITFEAPTAASIATTSGQSPVATVPATTPPSPPPTAASASPSSVVPRPATSPAPAVAAPPTSVMPAAPALAAEDQGIATAPVIAEATAPVPIASNPLDSEPRTLARIVGLLVLLGAALLGAWTWRSPAMGLAQAAADAPVEGGLARFRAPRTAEPPPIS